MEGHTTVGSGCRVGPAATLKRSILLPGACVGEEAYVQGCIVAGPGTTRLRGNPSPVKCSLRTTNGNPFRSVRAYRG